MVSESACVSCFSELCRSIDGVSSAGDGGLHAPSEYLDIEHVGHDTSCVPRDISHIAGSRKGATVNSIGYSTGSLPSLLPRYELL